MLTLYSALALGTILFFSSAEAFAPVGILKSSRLPATGSLNAIPETANNIESIVQSSDIILSKGDWGELAKSVVIVLAFGGGLIPSAIKANESMFGTLSGKRSGGDDGSDYVVSSGASGPALPSQALIFASEKIPLVDVIAIMGRIQSAEKICDWKTLPSTEQAATVQWLPRDMFKANIRKSKFNGWPVDPVSGEPVGGAELAKVEKGRISKNNAEIGDAALDAVFDTWAWGASIGTQDKVEASLALYKDGNTFNVNEFTAAAARGRAVTGVGALSFIVIQAVAYGSLFIAPFLRVFFDLDIGFGQLGNCEGVCNTLF